MKGTPETILAARIAARDTELHRAYDAYQALRRAAIRDQNDACARLAAANAGLFLCEQRAADQRYPTLFTL